MKLAKVYNPTEYEPTAYALWEASGAFKPTGEGQPYSVVMPPPNANGNLHMGHALTLDLQDILIRWRRMKGDKTVYIPGADHAGFETWVVFEKELAKQGKSRFDFSREELYSQVWDFVESKRGAMELQSRALGASASWDDLVFTLDDKVIKTVYKTFKRLWDDQLIYRGERLVNYCTFHQTGFADIEVEHEAAKTPLYYMKYGPFEVATTRPETKFGDTAVAVHPDDERYKKYVGREIEFDGLNGPVKLQVVADKMVDKDFGTGVVKITPAHDFNDFEVAERHNLPSLKVIGLDGKLTEVAGQYAGMTVQDARTAVVADLKAKGLLVKVDENYENRIARCYKCGTVIEPLLLEQWFLKVGPLAERAKQAIDGGEINFTPKSKARLITQYLDNLKDWNLSRQIPWGIPIPAFQNVNDDNDWVFDERVHLPTIEIDGQTYKREEDTFDTWFSSGQWPFVVTDYLDNGDLAEFYPTDMMETGHDLIDRWVARMVMLGIYATDKVPFKNVYLHGMVLDEKGQKMSKSKGNVINPMDIISDYGSDALRLGVVANRSAGQNQAFARDKVVAGRNFCNKLWNMARFIEPHLKGTETQAEPKTAADQWVIGRLIGARDAIDEHLQAYRFAEAADTVYHVIWNEVADWYLEAAKAAPDPAMLAWVLETCLKLAHPFAPFVTETIWTTLERSKTPLISSPWPEKISYHELEAATFDGIRELVTEIRYVASDLPGGKQTLLYQNDNLIDQNRELILQLARLKEVKTVEQPTGLRLAAANREAWLDVDADTVYEHQSKLEMRLTEARAMADKINRRLANKGYVDQAPKAIVESSRQQLAEQTELIERLERELDVLKA
ncbi:MAG TPA: valine--tRNA ligase [Candidatus Saccharimonadales bacterium]|nr:valine--tRNA ligase [Candidatus Saccharimonadales bacterium]